MTTKAEIKRLTGPLRERRPDLALLGRDLIMTPVRRLLRGLFFDATSSRNETRVFWFVMPLIPPQQHMSWHFGNRLGLRGRNRDWPLDDPMLSEDLVDTFARIVDPMLGTLGTFDDFIAFSAPKPYFFGCPIELELPYAAAIHAARGDFAAAEAAGVAMIDGKRGYWRPPSPLHGYITRDLLPLLRAGERGAVSALLHEWEAVSARNLGIEAFWQPSPFPIDLE